MISLPLTRIIAKISGDGYLGKRQIMYFNKCKCLTDEFEEDILTEFPNLKISKGIMNSGTPYVSVSGKEAVTKLKCYLPSFKSREIEIPKEILRSSPQTIKEYVRTFYDDEGCACLRLNKKTKEWKRNVTLSSNSYAILQQIKIILESHGIKTNKIIRNRSNSHYDESFVLAITGKDNFRIFREIIKFKNPRKSEILDLIIQSYNATSRRLLAFKKIEKRINELAVPKTKVGQLSDFPT